MAEHICHQAATPQAREPAVQDRMTPDRWKNVIEVLDRAGTPTRSRRADWIVAGSLVVIAVGLLLAGIPYLRYRSNVQACQNRLRQMYQAIEVYADNHDGKYPKVGEQPLQAYLEAFDGSKKDKIELAKKYFNETLTRIYDSF